MIRRHSITPLGHCWYWTEEEIEMNVTFLVLVEFFFLSVRIYSSVVVINE